MRTPSSPSASSSASASRAVLRMGRPFVLKDVLMSAAHDNAAGVFYKKTSRP